jgi:hypothetical protein
MNKIGNITGEMELDFDLADYDDWTFLNFIFSLN